MTLSVVVQQSVDISGESCGEAYGIKMHSVTQCIYVIICALRDISMLFVLAAFCLTVKLTFRWFEGHRIKHTACNMQNIVK